MELIILFCYSIHEKASVVYGLFLRDMKVKIISLFFEIISGAQKYVIF